MQRDTFKKLLELKLFKKLLEEKISNSEKPSISYEIVLMKTERDIEALQNYLRRQLNEV